MKRRYFTMIVASVLLILLGISVGVLAANPIRILINGVEVKSDNGPILNNGSVLVPLRTISEGLGAEVKWDSNKKVVQINSSDNIWDEPFDPWQNYEYNDYEAVLVVSRYLSLLQNAICGGDLLEKNYENVFTQSVINSPEPFSRVWYPGNTGAVGSSSRRLKYEILDGRHISDNDGKYTYEIAARLTYFNNTFSGENCTEWVKVYKVIVDPTMSKLLIDGEEVLKETKYQKEQLQNFIN